MTKYLLCVLAGVLLTVATYTLRDVIRDLDSRVGRIEYFLSNHGQ